MLVRMDTLTIWKGEPLPGVVGHENGAPIMGVVRYEKKPITGVVGYQQGDPIMGVVGYQPPEPIVEVVEGESGPVEKIVGYQPPVPIEGIVGYEKLTIMGTVGYEDGPGDPVEGVVGYEQGAPKMGMVRCPPNIEDLWTAEELAAVGLVVPAPFVPPAGKVAVSGPSFAMIDGEVREFREVADAPPPAPIVVSPMNLRFALAQMDLLDDVEAAVAAADMQTKIAWEYATLFDRSHPMVAAIGAVIGKTPAEIDELFALAAGLAA